MFANEFNHVKALEKENAPTFSCNILYVIMPALSPGLHKSLERPHSDRCTQSYRISRLAFLALPGG
jgi:hypothetical protein